MAEQLGRKVTISIGGEVRATARSKSLSINNEMIEVSGDGDDGVQRYIDEPGQKAVEITVNGMFDTSDDALPTLALSNDLSTEIVLDYGTYTIAGKFVMPSYSEGMEYNDAQTFDATFSSSGAVIKAPVNE